MIVIAGLGNPGKKYALTRHNCGFEAVDILSDRYRIPVGTEKFRALCGSGIMEGQKVLLLKPQTYMNLSGEAVRAACDFYRIDPAAELIVICDDVNMPAGSLRIRAKGSAGGHNGLKNIIAHLGTQEFIRIRIGAGEKPEGFDLADYVLGRFPLSQQADMIDAYDRAARAAAAIASGEDLQLVMSRYNCRKNSAAPDI